MDQGTPAAAKLHGGYAWEASPDLWSTHPLAGTMSGYLWLTCLSPTGTSAVCRGQLAAEMAKAGTDETIGFGGSYFDYDAGAVVRPRGLFLEGEPGSPAPLSDLGLGTSPMNPEVCRAALALPPDSGVAMPDAAGGAAGNPSDDASPGGTAGAGGAAAGGAAGSGSTPSDDGGCSTAPRRVPAHPGFAAWVVVAALLQVTRRRSRA